MPIFEYRCESCGKVFEELINGDRNKQMICPDCGSVRTEKLMSVIGGISMGKTSSSSHCGSSCANASACSSAGGGCCPHAG